MKKIIYLLLSLIFLACGTRTKETEKEKSILQENQKLSNNEDVFVKSYAESQTDLSQYLKESALRISSTGNPYQLRYNGIIFSGDANLEFSNREEKIIIKTYYKTITTYKSQTTHKSETIYKSVYNKKNTDLESKRDSWWLYLLISVISIVVGVYVWENYIRNLKIF